MSETFSKGMSTRFGRIRIDDRPRRLATHLECNEIVVINGTDLSCESVTALAVAGPIAVPSAQPFLTGCVATLGLRLILEAGIVLIDDLGQDIMPLHEGQEVAVTGSKALVDGCVVVTGSIVSSDNSDVNVVDSPALFATVDVPIENYLSKDDTAVLRRVSVPQLSDLRKRPILLIAGATDARTESRALARWRSEINPFVITIDGGADMAPNIRLSLDLVIGNAELTNGKTIRRARSFIVRVGGDGLVPDTDQLGRMGVAYDHVAIAGTSLDVALVAAIHSSAPAVVAAGVSYGGAKLVDAGRVLVAPVFFSRLTVSPRFIGAQAITATFRSRPHSWMPVLLAVVMLALIDVAL